MRLNLGAAIEWLVWAAMALLTVWWLVLAYLALTGRWC
jgi:hypothetical protein